MAKIQKIKKILSTKMRYGAIEKHQNSSTFPWQGGELLVKFIEAHFIFSKKKDRPNLAGLRFLAHVKSHDYLFVFTKFSIVSPSHFWPMVPHISGDNVLYDQPGILIELR